MITENDPRQINYRHMAHNMTISGIAVIGFGVWSILRAILYFVFHHIDFIAVFDIELAKMLDVAGHYTHTAANVIVLLFFISFLVIELLLRFYVGRSAMIDAAAKKKKSIIYIILALFMGFGLVTDFFTEISKFFSNDLSERIVYEVMASVVIDLTSGFAFLVLALSSIAARIYRKKLRDEGKMVHIDKTEDGHAKRFSLLRNILRCVFGGIFS
ncbi:MAG: hypothetical protein IJL89_08335 [Firmicutes bacterium]|nr:hypothetical protein [Bacillota bacterium]